MKKIKKILFFTICLLSLCSVLQLKLKVTATTSDNGKGNWSPGKSEEVDVLGMSHSSIWGTANGTNPQHINLLAMKTDGYSSKLVTWSVTDGNKKYTRQYLNDIAADYEKNHPGWIVVGGINADQYTTGYGSDLGAGSAYFTPQTYYPLIMDGESRIPITVNNITHMHVGFANNGSSDSLVSSSTIKSFVLTIVDEYKNELAKFDIDKINQSPSTGETTVWSTYISISKESNYVEQNINTTNQVYVVEEPELAYMNNSSAYNNGTDSIFGKGTISKVTTSVTLKSNQFAIETTNEKVIKALSEGTRIIVDAEWESEALNQVEASTGYHSVHRFNGVDQALVHTSYDGNRYSRAIVGKKADGTYVLLTVDVATDPNDLTVRYAGMGFDECNAVLKHYGVVEAYQMDGGGSVTSMYRNEDGEFVISNYPRDGIRANMTALLFVVRDPQIEVVDTTYHSVDFKKVANLGVNSTIENVTITINNKKYPLVDGQLTVDGLEENTEYLYVIDYDVVSNGQTKSLSITGKCQTKLYEGITPTFNIENVQKTQFIVTMEPNDKIKNVQVLTNSNTFEMINDKVEVTELISDTEYKVTIAYDIYDELTSKLYHREKTGLVVTTLSYEVPTIKEFALYKEYTDKVKIKYIYVDKDSVVKKVEIQYNDSLLEVSGKQGYPELANLDLVNQSYTAQLVITYGIDEETLIIKSEVITFGKAAQENVTHNINYVLDGGTLPETTDRTYQEKVGLSVFPTPTKDGFEFTGWYNEKGEKVTSISVDETTDITLTAHWERESKKGCNCGCNKDTSIRYILSLTTLLASSLVILRKKK